MKNWVKYIISAVIFFIIYTGLQYLFIKNIEWDIIILSTIIYFILNTICHILVDKKLN